MRIMRCKLKIVLWLILFGLCNTRTVHGRLEGDLHDERLGLGLYDGLFNTSNLPPNMARSVQIGKMGVAMLFLRICTINVNSNYN